MDKGFVVIGGQYEKHFYGFFTSLRSAQLCATKHCEYWDNWQGFHFPVIYRVEDCVYTVTHGLISYPDGSDAIFPKPGAFPFMIKDSASNRWSRFLEVSYD